MPARPLHPSRREAGQQLFVINLASTLLWHLGRSRLRLLLWGLHTGAGGTCGGREHPVLGRCRATGPRGREQVGHGRAAGVVEAAQVA